jgi:hypothetical protein
MSKGRWPIYPRSHSRAGGWRQSTGREADQNSRNHETKSLAEDHSQNFGPLRAERNADADFVSLQRHCIGHHAENGDGGQQQANSSERAERDKTTFRLSA